MGDQRRGPIRCENCREVSCTHFVYFFNLILMLSETIRERKRFLKASLRNRCKCAHSSLSGTRTRTRTSLISSLIHTTDSFKLIDYPGGFPQGSFAYPFQYTLPHDLPGIIANNYVDRFSCSFLLLLLLSVLLFDCRSPFLRSSRLFRFHFFVHFFFLLLRLPVNVVISSSSFFVCL